MAEVISGQLQCVIVTPEKKVAETPADFVVLTAHDGQIGILPEHSPLLCRLAPGLLRIDTNSKQDYYFVAGGFAEILDNRITVLTPESMEAGKMDPKAIENELHQAEELPTVNQADRDKKIRTLERARGKRNTFLEADRKKNQHNGHAV